LPKFDHDGSLLAALVEEKLPAANHAFASKREYFFPASSDAT
jgi:hypothetical protein